MSQYECLRFNPKDDGMGEKDEVVSSSPPDWQSTRPETNRDRGEEGGGKRAGCQCLSVDEGIVDGEEEDGRTEGSDDRQ